MISLCLFIALALSLVQGLLVSLTQSWALAQGAIPLIMNLAI